MCMDTHGATCVAGTVSGCGLNVLPVPASSTSKLTVQFLLDQAVFSENT